MREIAIKVISDQDRCEEFKKFVYRMRFIEYPDMFFDGKKVTYKQHKAYIENEIKEGYCVWIKVVDTFNEKAIQGVGCYKIKGNICELGRIMVAPDKQSKGVGKAIIDKLISHAKTRGKTRYQLEVKATNQRAIRFYKNNKFDIVSKDDDVIVMARNEMNEEKR